MENKRKQTQEGTERILEKKKLALLLKKLLPEVCNYHQAKILSSKNTKEAERRGAAFYEIHECFIAVIRILEGKYVKISWFPARSVFLGLLAVKDAYKEKLKNGLDTAEDECDLDFMLDDYRRFTADCKYAAEQLKLFLEENKDELTKKNSNDER